MTSARGWRFLLLAIAGLAPACHRRAGGPPPFTAPLVLGGRTVAPVSLERGRNIYTQYCRPCHGDDTQFATDPHWRDLLLFHEYFHGETGRGLGASHQTGWTALVLRFIEDLARARES